MVYRNKFQRNWYKLASIGGQGIGGFVADAQHQWGANQTILRGTADARIWCSRTTVSTFLRRADRTEPPFPDRTVDNDLIVETRYHQDEVDRYQPTDTFDQTNG